MLKGATAFVAVASATDVDVLSLAVMNQVRWYDMRYTIVTNMACAGQYFCPLLVSHRHMERKKERKKAMHRGRVLT
jgi:hypothetical protein